MFRTPHGDRKVSLGVDLKVTWGDTAYMVIPQVRMFWCKTLRRYSMRAAPKVPPVGVPRRPPVSPCRMPAGALVSPLMCHMPS